jgi:hypothetical protein
VRCKACNAILEDAELTRKDPNGEFYDLCSVCFNSSQACEWEDDSFFEDYRRNNLSSEDIYDTLY